MLRQNVILFARAYGGVRYCALRSNFCLFTFNYLLIPPALCAMRYALLFLACQAIYKSNPSGIRCDIIKSNRSPLASVVSCPVVGAVVSC